MTDVMRPPGDMTGAFPTIPPGGLLFGLGIDVTEAARIRRLLERLPRAYERLFSEQERAYCDGFSDPWLALRRPLRRQGGGRQGARNRYHRVRVARHRGTVGWEAPHRAARRRRRHRAAPGRDEGRSLAEPHRRHGVRRRRRTQGGRGWMSPCCWACTPPTACRRSTAWRSTASASPAGTSWSAPASPWRPRSSSATRRRRPWSSPARATTAGTASWSRASSSTPASRSPCSCSPPPRSTRATRS